MPGKFTREVHPAHFRLYTALIGDFIASRAAITISRPLSATDDRNDERVTRESRENDRVYLQMTRPTTG